jgi:hypothetical protein
VEVDISSLPSTTNHQDLTHGRHPILGRSTPRHDAACRLFGPTNTNASALVNEGDFITFTPSGGGGANVSGWFGATIAEEG